MGRGRRKSITSTAAPLIPGRVPDPPPELTEPEQAVWRRVIGGLPPGWVTDGSAPLAVNLCRHIHFADQLAIDIDQARAELAAALAEPADGPKAEKAKATRIRRARAQVLSLSRAHLLQSGAVARLSQKLRLSKLSQFTRDSETAAIAARNSPAGPEPWQDWNDRDRRQ